ncbi:MAG: nuclear transport factor 2 family protein [Gaiellaceae bacterium]
MNVAEWAERYARAWEDADDDAVGELFTEDATYRSDPFQEPYRGREAIRGYWRDVTARQANVEVVIGRTMAAGDRALVEWWTQMDSDGAPVTLPGALLLELDETGRCRALREYWNLDVGSRVPPPDGWGT